MGLHASAWSPVNPFTAPVALWTASADQRLLDRLAGATVSHSVDLFLEMQRPPRSPNPSLLTRVIRLSPTFLGRVVEGLTLADRAHGEATMDLALMQLAPDTPEGRVSLTQAMVRLCDHYDAASRHWAFERLLRAGVPLYEPMGSSDNPSPFLALCAAKDSLPTLRGLFDHHGAHEHLEEALPNGHTPLSYAVTHGFMPVVCFLVMRGADPTRQTVFDSPDDRLSGQEAQLQSPMEFVAERRSKDLPLLEEALAMARHEHGQAAPIPPTTRPRQRA